VRSEGGQYRADFEGLPFEKVETDTKSQFLSSFSFRLYFVFLSMSPSDPKRAMVEACSHCWKSSRPETLRFRYMLDVVCTVATSHTCNTSSSLLVGVESTQYHKLSELPTPGCMAVCRLQMWVRSHPFSSHGSSSASLIPRSHTKVRKCLNNQKTCK
jgi:hypothetical protein